MVATSHHDVSAWHAGQANIPPAPILSAALRAQIQADLRVWATRYPIFDPARFPALALTLAAHLPAARREDRALVGLIALWIIAFDNLVDEGEIDPALLDTLVARCDAIVGLGRRASKHVAAGGDALDRVEQALREIVVRIAERDPAPALHAWWATSFRATIAGIVRQREWGRGQRPVPGYDAVLPLLLDSIGVHPVVAAGAIVGREPGLAARLPALTSLTSVCALVIRQANDLRTWEKDAAAGQINTLVALRDELLRADPGLSPKAAHDRAIAILTDRLASGLAYLTAADYRGETAAGVVRLASVTASIYATHDYHTFRVSGD